MDWEARRWEAMLCEAMGTVWEAMDREVTGWEAMDWEARGTDWGSD